MPFFHSPPEHVIPIATPVSIDILVHDPDNKDLTITAVNTLPSWLSLIPNLENDALLTGIPTSTGTYNVTLEVTDGTHSSTQELEIEIVSNIGSWIQIGEEFVSEEESEFRIFSKVADNGVDLYSMGISRSNEAFVYYFDGNEWSKVGENSVAQSSHGALNIDPISGNPWKFHVTTNRSTVYEYVDNIWKERGEPLSISSFHDIIFAQNGSVYVSGYNSGKISFHELVDENWIELESPQSSNTLFKPRVINSNNDKVLMLCSEFVGANGYSKVYLYDNEEWTGLGDLINPDKFTRSNSNSYHAIASASNGNLFVAIDHEDGLYIYEWDGLNWSVIAESLDGGGSREFDIAINDLDELFVTYLSPYCKAICQKWDGTEWVPQGIPEFTKNILDVSSIVLDNKDPGIVYIDNYQSLGKIGAKRFDNKIVSNIESNQIQNTLVVYPNPTNGNLQLKDVNMNGQAYSIFNDLGILTNKGVVKDHLIKCDHLRSGHYTVVFESKNQTFHFVKTK